MITKIRTTFYFKAFTMLMLLVFLNSIAFPSVSYALSGGPSQPEVHSFAPIGTTDMVDLSSGDFNYNLPLLEVGGYPINMVYNSGISMDQEASWVGLGWNINPGVVNRNMRGLPDDAKGDLVENEMNIKPMRTIGLNLGGDLELVGLPLPVSINASFGINYNNYNGWNFTNSIGLSASISKILGEPNNQSQLSGVGSLSVSDGGRFNANVKASLKQNIEGEKETSSFDNTGVGLSFDNTGFTGFSVYTNLAAKVKLKKDGTIRKHRDYNGSIGYNFSDKTYMPTIDFARFSQAYTFNFKIGGTVFASDISGSATGFASFNKLKNTFERVPSYGYLHSESKNENGLRDFNREADRAFHKYTTNLPITNLTYDIYSANGHGVGGSFRPFRSNVGSVYDRTVKSDGLDASGGLEIAVGNAFSFGVDGALSFVGSEQTQWNKGNGAFSKLQYESKEENASNDLTEPFYFKQIGELSVDEEMKSNSTSMYGNVGGNYPARIKLGFFHSAKNIFEVEDENGNITEKEISSKINRSNRAKRNQLMSYLTKAEAQLLKKPINQAAKAHHLAEMSVIKEDGSKYVYGNAAYNKIQEEYMFNVDETIGSNFCGFVPYTSEDISKSNKKGISNFYHKKKVPAYAHSYMLTEILSADYIDVDHNGPSDQDYGNWTKFEYDKKIENYNWRSPYTPQGEENLARLNRGLISQTIDGKGMITYGEKELYYLKKISTKTHVAIFHTSPRKDAYEAAGVNGGKGEDSMYQLDKIALYNKTDYNLDPANAVPIKTVHFKYNYTLCKGIYNSENYTGSSSPAENSGKLTLEKVYFSYGKSEKSLLSPYEFSYSEGESNPNYDPNAYDMWGAYKTVEEDDCVAISEFPYVRQESSSSDLQIRADAWTLKSIKLPSGGQINVEFESDDYAFVQNRKAMQLYEVIGFSDTETLGASDFIPSSNSLHEIYTDEGQKQFIFLKTPAGLSTTEVKRMMAYIYDNYIYFRFKMQLLPGQFEYISSYFKMESEVYDYDALTGHLKLKVKAFKIGGSAGDGGGVDPNAPVSPFAKAAWQFTRANRPGILKGQYNEFNESIEIDEFIDAAGGMIGNLIDLFKGPNRILRNRGVGQYIDTDKSWVRLNNPYGKKYGGNSRVKEISMVDNWEQMTNNQSGVKNAEYTQAFDYTTSEGLSSGVADWEPIVSKENPFVIPVIGANIEKLTGDESQYTEGPIGMSYYPAARIVYSEVKVRNKAIDSETGEEFTDNLSKTGFVETAYYTSKDFPTKVKQTQLKARPEKPNPIFSLLQVNVRDYMTTSQGYSVELNDMSGKEKYVKVYAENNDAPISAVYYNYDPNSEDNLPSKLKLNDQSNKVFAIYPDGTVRKSRLGIEMEVMNDFREFKTKSHTASVDGNLAAFLAFVFPALIPSAFPNYSSQFTMYRSAVTTKVIFRRGILNKITKIEDNSSFSTRNLAYDAETGNVLLTATQNEFGDDIYSFTYPAHWMYDGMGQAYKNVRSSGLLSVGGSGYVLNDGLVIGDELVFIDNGTSQYAWVANNEGGKQLINEKGEIFSIGDNAQYLVLKSGRKNQQSIPVGSIISMENPIVENPVTGNITFGFKTTSDLGNYKILDANAMAYSDQWRTKGKMNTGLENYEWGFYENQLSDNTNSFDENAICSTYKDYLNALIRTKTFEGTIPNNSGEIFMPQTVITNGQVSYDYSSEANILNDLNLYNIGIDCDPENTHDSQFSVINNDLIEISAVDHSDECGCISISDEPFLEKLDNLNMFNGWQVTNVTILDKHELATLGDSAYNFNVTLSNGLETEEYTVEASCWPYLQDIQFQNDCDDGEFINPFLAGIRGQWKPETQYVYNTSRVYNDIAQSIDLRESGVYSSLDPYWLHDGTNWVDNALSWQYTSTISQYSPFGNEVENMDALGRYSAALFGYSNTLPKAVAQNARYNEIYNENFEDYKYPIGEDCYYEPHFKFEKADFCSISDSYAHTGKYSLKIGFNGESKVEANNNYIISRGAQNPNTAQYTLEQEDILGGFSPSPYSGEAPKKFILSLWQKAESGLTPLGAIIEIFDGSTTSTIILPNNPTGIIIDGWQRLEYEFELDYKGDVIGNNFKLILNNKSLTESIYVDDIRIQPFNSSLKAFVYHPITQRYVAELDENNYATFYEYDNAGRLLRIKKETERGIMTIQESFNHIQTTEVNTSEYNPSTDPDAPSEAGGSSQ